MNKKIIFPVLIIYVVVILFLANFSPNSWLSGWDNLHPEFNFGLNIQRSIYGVWQQYQGLGLVGGMGHAADLPRQLLLGLFSFVFPDNWLRQLYFFLMLLLGPLGTYFFLEKIILRSVDQYKRGFISLAGGLFYLFNLSTIQTFYTPFEPFVVHFGFLPWLFLSAFIYINHQSFKNLVFLTVVNILAVSQAYVPTTFLVYFFAIFCSLLIYSFQKKFENTWASIKVLLITLLINTFWILPFVYFTFTNISVTAQAKINQMTTENVYLENKKFGAVTDVALLKGFWFDMTNFNQTNKNFDYLMTAWRNHLNNPLVVATGWLLFIIVILGIFASFKDKNQYRWVLLSLFLISFAILASNTPPFSWIDNFLHQLPHMAQVLRSPFTKFSVLASFSYAIFFAFGVKLILDYIGSKLTKIALSFLILGSLLIFIGPVFRGDLFYNQNKVNIPGDYFQTWDFFKTQNPSSRLAFFPVPTFWGWNFYKWGYSGSGFLWYGLSQPILDRAFDVWSKYDENYYWEISQAIYSNDVALLEKVLEKYQISWLLLDENVIYPSSPKSLYADETEKLFASSSKIALAEKFGKIKIYQVILKDPVNNFVFLAKNLPGVGPVYYWNNFDRAYTDNGNYTNKTNDFYYPFRTLLTSRSQEDLEFSVEEKEDSFIFRKILPAGFEKYYLQIPEIDQDLLWVDPNDLDKIKNLPEDIYFTGKDITAVVPKVGGLFSAEVDPGSKREFWLPNLPNNFAYLISTSSKNIAGKPFNFWIENLTTRRPDLETYLPASPFEKTSYFIQPPMKDDGLGYTLHFDEKKFGSINPKNELGEIKVHPLPFNFLTGLVLKKEISLPPAESSAVKVEHPNPSTYFVSLPTNGQSLSNSTLILSQAYDQGWKAYEGTPLIGKEIKDHVLVNNWENGWNIENFDPKKRIAIIFMPQYLQFTGMFLSLVWFSLIIGKVIFRRRLDKVE